MEALENCIQIQNTPALVEVNFDALREALEIEVSKYKIVVTSDTVKEAKALSTELNATKKLIDDRRKDEVAKASEPIKQFDEQMKELVIICEKGRKDILDQVARFEEERKEKIKALLIEKRQTFWDQFKVTEEFQSVEIDDLIKLGSLTDGGKLTNAARQRIEMRVRENKELQDRTDRRLLELKAECFEASLDSPLERVHVESFLFADDEIYKNRLQQLVATEIERQEKTKARERQRIQEQQEADRIAQEEREEQRLQNQQQEEVQDVPVIEATEEETNYPEPQEIAQAMAEPVQQEAVKIPRKEPAPGNVIFSVTAIFNAEVPNSCTETDIRKEFMKALEKTGMHNSLVDAAVTKIDA